MKRLIFVLVVVLFSLFSLGVNAEENIDCEITDIVKIDAVGFSSKSVLTDDKEKAYAVTEQNATLTVSTDKEKVAGIYILFDEEPGSYRVSVDGSDKTQEQNDIFLHQYIDVKDRFGLSDSVTLYFDENTKVTEIYVFADGTLPSWVQIWQPPCDNADLLLLTTHADDEQLFFAGTLPYYTAKGYAVQVAYVTDHNDSYGNQRHHERLNGLWTAGVRNYPVFGRFADAYSESIEGAIRNLEYSGKTQDDVIEFLINTIRRFKPLVIMGQDFNGEYGHGQHMLATDSLVKAVERAADETVVSGNDFEAYDTPKTYIHLYNENTIVLNYDEPMEELDGRTPFEVSQEAFMCHKSQHYTWFKEWLCGTVNNPITKAEQIKKYSPLKFGLYRTTVGLDNGNNDMFENVTPYFIKAEQEKQKQVLENETPDKVQENENKNESGNGEEMKPNKISNVGKSMIIVAVGCAIAAVWFFARKKNKK